MISTQTGVTDESMKSLLNRLNKISSRLGEKGARTPVGDLLNEGGLELETLAKKQITADRHVVTGRLRSSIHLKSKVSESYSYTDMLGESFDGSLQETVKPGETIVVGTNVDYALKIENLDSYLYRSAVYLQPYLVKNFRKLMKDTVDGKIGFTTNFRG